MLGTLIPARAADLAPPSYIYGAKFHLRSARGGRDVKGNLCDGDQHPQSPDDSRFLKKIVVAKEETPGQGFAVPFTQRDKLAVEYVDCPLIYAITGIFGHPQRWFCRA